MQLPPLNALRTFEAAGRLGSIRAAAEELVVTPGAVSRQVRVLEAWLGVPLFRHEGRTIQLTDVGARYLEAASQHLSAIAKATNQVTGRWRSEETLQIRSYTLFANNWLIPRLPRFKRSQPWIELELDTSSRPEDFGRFDVDAEIRPNPHQRPADGFDSDLLFTDTVVIVCNPDYQAEYRLHEPADLHRVPADGFLRSVAAPLLWERWLEASGIDGVDPSRGARFGDSSLTYRAATAGQGVTLAPRTFVGTELNAGTLVIPFDARGQLLEFYLFHPADRPRRRAFSAFRSWLLAESNAQSVPAGAGRAE
ncbi:LysR substrate-binding domain-containing protein [Pseudonocardia zijingensis]|jgi:LysR family glycine cleavage system transcriptional activator|uniref:Transcriptional regulator GcvA n=1 Tax=Pseudonocardia zijingensis TaxID=153376 RepID=A0ABP3ZWG6_9PSEU